MVEKKRKVIYGKPVKKSKKKRKKSDVKSTEFLLENDYPANTVYDRGASVSHDSIKLKRKRRIRKQSKKKNKKSDVKSTEFLLENDYLVKQVSMVEREKEKEISEEEKNGVQKITLKYNNSPKIVVKESDLKNDEVTAWEQPTGENLFPDEEKKEVTIPSVEKIEQDEGKKVSIEDFLELENNTEKNTKIEDTVTREEEVREKIGVEKNLLDDNNKSEQEKIVEYEVIEEGESSDLKSTDVETSENVVKKEIFNRIVYNKRFKSDLIEKIAVMVSNLPPLDESSKNIGKRALNLYEYAIKKGLTPSNMDKCKNSGLLSIILVYYALLSYSIRSIGDKQLSASALWSLLGVDYIKMDLSNSSGGSLTPSKFYQYLSDDIKNSIDDVKISRKKIVYDSAYKIALKKYIKIVISHLPISRRERKDLQEMANYLYDYAIENGLKPSDIDKSKNANYLSIILVYYALRSLGIKKLDDSKISIAVIWEFLGDDFKKLKLSKTSYATIQPALFIPFLPTDIKTTVENITHPHQLSYEEIKDFVESFNYTLLTNEVDFLTRMEKDKTAPSSTEIEVQCKFCNYEWDTSYGVLLVKQSRYKDTQISGCRKCKDQLPKSYKDIKKLVESKGGKLVTTEEEFETQRERDETIPTKTKIKVSCKKDDPHKWDTTHDNIKKNKSFCPHCSGTATLSYEDIAKYVESRGASLLTPKEKFEKLREQKGTVPSKTEIKIFDPKCNHEWYTTKDRMSKSWCPRCQEGRYEGLLRWYLEKIFSFVCGILIYFPQTKLHNLFECPDDIDWNSFNKMHFDCYSRLNLLGQIILLAFEFNGYQHYIFPNHIHPNTKEGKKKFKTQNALDKKKGGYSQKNGIVLIIFPYKIDKQMNHPKKIQKYIVKQFKKEKGIDLNDFNLPLFDHRFPNSYQKTLS